MLVLSNRLLSMPVMSIQTGGQLAQISGAIIDPRQLRLVAFYCHGPGLEANQNILHTDDIREFADIGLIINSSDNIMSPDDLVRLKEVLGFKFELIGKQVVDDTGRTVGKTTAYSVEVETFYIIKLHVNPGFLKSFRTTEKIIDRSQIVEITAKKIVVKAAAVEQEKPAEVKALPVVENPFRPQPDGSSIKERP